MKRLKDHITRRNSDSSDQDQPTAPDKTLVYDEPEIREIQKVIEALSPEPTKYPEDILLQQPNNIPPPIDPQIIPPPIQTENIPSVNQQNVDITFESVYEEPNFFKDGINKLTHKDEIDAVTIATKIIDENFKTQKTFQDDEIKMLKTKMENETLINIQEKADRDEKIKSLTAQVEQTQEVLNKMLNLMTNDTVQSTDNEFRSKNMESTNEKVLKGLEKGKYTRSQIFEHPKYVKSTLKKRKSRYRDYDNYTSSDTDSDFSQPIDRSIFNQKNDNNNESDDDISINKINKVLENIANKKLLPAPQTEKVRLAMGTSEIRPEKIKRKIVAYETCVVGNATELGLTNFLKQFPYEHFKTFTQQEYNLILHKFLGADLRKKCAAQNILPGNLDTASYTTELSRIHHSEMVEESIVEQKLFNYQALETDIVKIYHDINAIIDLMPNNSWDEQSKAKKLFFTVKRLLPPAMALNFTALESINYSTQKSQYPNRQQQRFYLCKNAVCINEELKRNMRYKHRINEVSGTKQRNNTEKNTKESTPQSNISQQSVETTAAIQEIRTYMPPKCQTCNKIGHSKDNCFFHPDLETAYLNQKNRNQPCMLCSAPDHQAKYCDLFPNQVPVLIPCKWCRRARILNYHEEKNCKIQQKN